MTIFEIDGFSFPNTLVTKLTQSFEVLDTDNSGRLIEEGQMHRDIIGTFYNWTLEIYTSDIAEHDMLYEIISSPVPSHVIKVPYAQGYKTLNAYISKGEHDLLKMRPNGNTWGKMTLKFIAMKADRTP